MSGALLDDRACLQIYARLAARHACHGKLDIPRIRFKDRAVDLSVNSGHKFVAKAVPADECRRVLSDLGYSA